MKLTIICYETYIAGNCSILIYDYKQVITSKSRRVYETKWNLFKRGERYRYVFITLVVNWPMGYSKL